MLIFGENDQIKINQGERHRLIGLDDYALFQKYGNIQILIILLMKMI